MQTSKLFNTLVAAIVLSGASITASHAADSAPKAQAPADTVVAANAAAVVSRLHAARDGGADIVVFPEMVVAGYPPEDLLLKPDFVAACMEAARTIAR